MNLPGQNAIDAWTFVHLASGFVLAKTLPLKRSHALCLFIGFEIAEAILRKIPGNNGKGLFEPESWKNIGCDILAGYAGFEIGKKV